MAVGRADYQAGVVPIKSGYSLMQSPYVNYESDDIASSSDDSLCAYECPVGYRLQITGIRLTTNSPSIDYCYLYIGATVIVFYYWDMLLIDNYPDGGSILVNAGEIVNLRITNRSDITKTFGGTIIGLLEQIET